MATKAPVYKVVPTTTLQVIISCKNMKSDENYFRQVTQIIARSWTLLYFKQSLTTKRSASFPVMGGLFSATDP